MSAEAPKIKSVVPVEHRKQRLIEAALEEFLENGYDRASLDAIASRAGVSKPTIYRWHSSKEGIFLAATLSLLNLQIELLKNLPQDTRPPEIVLREAARIWLDSYLRPEMRRLIRLTIAEAERFPALVAEVRAVTQRVLYEPIAAYLSRLEAEGVIRTPNIELLANIFGILSVQGFRFMYMQPRNTEDDYDHIDMVIDLFLNGCRNR